MTITKDIHLQLRQALTSTQERIRFAQFVAETIDRGPKPGLPRILNDDTTAMSFQLDQGNDYFLIIDDVLSVVRLNMRYSNDEVKKALLTWIGHRWGGVVVVQQ